MSSIETRKGCSSFYLGFLLAYKIFSYSISITCHGHLDCFLRAKENSRFLFVTTNHKESCDQTPAVIFAICIPCLNFWQFQVGKLPLCFLPPVYKFFHIFPFSYIRWGFLFLADPFGTLKNESFCQFFLFEMKNFHSAFNSRWPCTHLWSGES